MKTLFLYVLRFWRKGSRDACQKLFALWNRHCQ